MKNYKNILSLVLVILSLTLTSCEEDDLIKEPLSELNSANYWENETNANLALTTAYQRLNGGTWSHTEANYVIENFRSDLTKSGADVVANYPDQNAFSTYTVVDNNTRMLTYWDRSYDGINAANQVIHNVGLMTEEQISSDAKKRIIAEAKFLRGYFHFRLLMNWEEIVVFDFLPQTVDELSRPLSTREEAWTAIEKDFTESAADLSITQDDANRGRATRGAALAFLGKSHLNQLDWSNAATILKQVIDLGVYELASDYASLFDGSNEATNVLNRETLFDVAFTFNEVNGSNVVYAGLPNFAALEMNGWEAMLPTQKLLSEMKSEGRISSEVGPVSGLNKYDERSYGSIFFNDPDVDIYGATYEATFGVGSDKPGWKKYLHRDELYPNGWRSDINTPLIRYADVLLMYAEALNEQGTGDPINYINQVRARAFLPPVTASSQEEIRQQIMHERAVEFALEGQRFYDLRRWGRQIMTDEISNSGKEGADNFVFEEDAFLPIPANEKLNNPNID
ncbi:RagB/SusD family nutrient uptake outer membrane protein [Aquimarina sp. 2201CG5-10]|uniref:RagB/SusD family nutrient uptake outer membrane protein n=1 Tax=Aquimarina callyspongiae TaxID=3098150 RepID=UPI002AB5BD71|nr:RagB/SusD family nutrient uptake outer membrane protein [Aquimarina sp. 2201CG5-10]MDY8137964.1 RagB/SusD family nutrient uptake outer membrane protein [Aquimarina sp. 2201CG5-10]